MFDVVPWHLAATNARSSREPACGTPRCFRGAEEWQLLLFTESKGKQIFGHFGHIQLYICNIMMHTSLYIVGREEHNASRKYYEVPNP